MKSSFKINLLPIIILLAILLGVFPQQSLALEKTKVDAALNDTAAYMLKTVTKPEIGSLGGEWAILGLARSGYSVQEKYYQDYYSRVENIVKEKKGILHSQKYTEYSRVTIALTSIGKDPRNVGGYNLLTPLGDYEKTIWQGLNGPIWALIALDTANYPMPSNSAAKTQATRDMYINYILKKQLADGGFSLSGSGTADPDITGMALQALAKYQDRAEVKKVISEALNCLSKIQNAEGGFSHGGQKNVESAIQVIVALGELGIPLDDVRFVKNGNSLGDNLLSFYRKGQGFLHVSSGSGSNQMASEQGLYALASTYRALEGKNSLYCMSDALKITDPAKPEDLPGPGLDGKNPDIKTPGISTIGKTFADIINHANKTAIEALASRGIITGKTETSFDPNANMTRAEYATIVVRALGLTPKANAQFTDVSANSWYAAYIGTAYDYGIINGVSANKFEPQSTITREAAAVMVARAAKLCGMNTKIDAKNVKDILKPFSDYQKSSEWAQEALAFCYQEKLLNNADLNIRPKEAIKRFEVAQILFNLLNEAKLISK